MKDISYALETASQRQASWTRDRLIQALNKVQILMPGAEIDWDEGDEGWARSISATLISAIRVDAPLAIVAGEGPTADEVEGELEHTGITVVRSSTWDADAFRLDVNRMKQAFPTWIWPEDDFVDPNRLSASDLWWATL